MSGLGDTDCTDDELDVLALCPSSGGVPDYTNCICTGGTMAQATATAAPFTLPTWWPLAAAGAVALYFLSGKR